jgi:hypothetical protein
VAAKFEKTVSERAFCAAQLHFPRAELAIRRLMHLSEAFRDMCEELADAQAALADALSKPGPLSEVRRQEWQELIDRLAAEIAATLQDNGAEIEPPASR